MLQIKVYKVPQFMSKNINVITVNNIPICTVRGKKNLSKIMSKLNGYDVTIEDGRINKIVNTLIN